MMTEVRHPTPWTAFSPRAYLHDYYADVGAENQALLAFAVRAFRRIPAHGRLLDFGSGPTIYPLIAAAPWVAEIHMGEYLAANRHEVCQWLANSPTAFDWNPFIEHTLILEGDGAPTPDAIAQRAAVIRQRVTHVGACDANLLPPIAHGQPYDVLISSFCTESATDDTAQWRRFLHHMLTVLRPGGWALIAALSGASSYPVGAHQFPAVCLHEGDLIAAMRDEGFGLDSLVLEHIPADRPSRSYDGILLMLAHKQDGATQ